MKTVSKEILKEAASKLMFDMKDEQYDVLLKEFNIIENQITMLSKVPGIDDVTPMTFPFDVANDYLRDDVAELPLKQEDALKNASNVVDGQIRLPKVVG